MALPAQIGTVTLIARLEQMVLAAAPDLATPGTWRAHLTPTSAFSVSLPDPQGAGAPRVVFEPGSDLVLDFDTVTGELLGPDGTAGVDLPVVLWAPDVDGDFEPVNTPATGQDWTLTLIQDDTAILNDSDDPTDGPYEVPRVWGTWLFSFSFADDGQTRDLALIGVPGPSEEQAPAFVAGVQAALTAYFAAHPAGPAGARGPQGIEGPPGPNTIPTNQAIADAIVADGPTKITLNDTIAVVVDEAVPEVVAVETPSIMFDTAADPSSAFAVRQGAQIASSASQVLLSREITAITGSTNLTTFQAIVGATFSFVAPLSGIVDISIQCGYTMPTGTASLELILRSNPGNTEIANTRRRIERIVSNANSKQATLTYRVRISGLIAGATYGYGLAMRNPDGTAAIVSLSADTGATWGPMYVEVLSVPAPVTPDTGLYVRLNSTSLAAWETAKAAVAGATRDAKLLGIGDSTMAGYLLDGPMERLVPKLVGRGLAAALGGTHPRLNAGSNPRYTAGAGWPSSRNYGFGSQGWQYNNPAGTLTYADPAYTYDSFDVYFVRGGGATSITLQIDSETPQVFDGTGATGIGKLSITSTSPGASTSHVLKISAVGSGAIVFVEPWLSTVKRIRVANAGVPSTNTPTWNGGSGIYSKSTIVAYDPDVILCLLGANDAVSGYDATTVVDNLAGIASAKPTAPFIVVSSIPCEILSEAALQRQYAIRSRYASSLPFIDLNMHFVDWETADAEGWMSDIRHPDAEGMEQQAILFDAALARSV